MTERGMKVAFVRNKKYGITGSYDIFHVARHKRIF